MQTESTHATAAEPQKLLLTPLEVAHALGVSRASIFSMRNAGKRPLPVRLTPRAPRRCAVELQRWVEAGCPRRDVWEQRAIARC